MWQMANDATFLCDCLNEVKSLPEYKGTSRNCRQIATTLEIISSALSDKKSESCVIQFAAEITAILKSVLEKLKLSESGTVASITTRRMRMWKAYHKATSCAKYRQKWIALLNSLALDDVSKMPISIIIQHVAKMMLDKMIVKEIPCNEVDNTEIMEISDDEAQAIRFTCGFVIRAVKKKWPKIKSTLFLLRY